jgi:P27 family predicted phage terminase small subunit
MAHSGPLRAYWHGPVAAFRPWPPASDVGGSGLRPGGAESIFLIFKEKKKEKNAMGGKGSGGHNRKPTALKKLQGNPGKRKLNKNEPAQVLGEPLMPLGLSAEAQEEWRGIVPLLLKMGLLTEADGKALAAYCSCYAQWMLAEKEIAQYGITLRTESGYKVNPAVRVRSDALCQMKSFLIEFGLTPASRSKLSFSNASDNVDPFEAFLEGPRESTKKPN